jgi:hypothetical protein
LGLSHEYLLILSDRPTKDFINRHLDIYNNANISQFSQTGLVWPKNRLVDKC